MWTRRIVTPPPTSENVFAKMMGVSTDSAPNVNAWLTRLGQRPAVAKVR